MHGAVPAVDDEVEAPRDTVDVVPHFPGHRAARLIGRGGFGDVYCAEPERGGPAVAIKVARAERPLAIVSLLGEVEVMTAIGPPHVPAVHAQGALPDGRPYVIMEYLDTPTLAARLAPGASPIALGDACALVLAILRALAGVHAGGWVHRDLKPENVFVDAKMRATLVDFGLVLRRSATGTTTDDGAAAGTPEYMAPEQCEGRDDVDARADLYAIGVILFELVTGRPPFWGSRAVVQEAHRSRRPPRLATLAEGRPIPAALEDIVARCLAKDPNDRFADAGALIAAIEAAAGAIAAVDPAGAAPAPEAVDLARRGARAKSERLTVGLLFFESDADVATVQARVVALGGLLAHGGAGRFVAVFGHDLAQNPARRALRAAEAMLQASLCTRARLDLAPVAMQARRDGTKRFVSPLFSRDDVYPSADDAPGIAISPAAAAVLPDAARTDVDAPRVVVHGAGILSDDDPTLTTAASAGPLLGRDALVEALLGSARAAAEGRVPTMVSVVGDAGHGKSHLFRVLGGRLDALGIADVLDLRAREPALGDIDHTLSELLRRGLGLPAVPPPDGGAELLHRRLEPSAMGPRPTDPDAPPSSGADLAPAVALALGWMASGPPDPAMASALRAMSAAPGALRAALTVAAGDALRRLAEARPLFVIIDDAHYGSDVLVAALEYAALAEHRVPIWICALARPSFAAERAAWGERAGHHEAHVLGALDPESAAALCRRLLLPIESVPDSAVQRLLDRAESVPLLLVELVRGLKHRGIVRKSPKGESYYLATDELDLLPDLPLIEWLARSELDALSPALREHARLIALLGGQVTTAEIEGVIRHLEQQGAADTLLDARIGTQRLVSAGLVLEDRQGRIGFRHDLVRETIARSTSETMRRRIHLAATAHYGEQAPSGAEERRLAQFALHSSAAGMASLAEHAYLELAELARARHAYTEAERLYSRALEQAAAEAGIDRCIAYRGRGLMRYRIGRYHDALDDFARARSAASDVAAQVDILLDEATTYDWMDDYKKSEERVEETRALLTLAASPSLDARLLLGFGRSAHRFSRNEEGAELLERAASLAEPLGDDGYETLVIALVLLGHIYPGLGRLEDARRTLTRAIDLCEAHGDLLHLGGALNNRGLLYGCLEDKEGMAADLSRTIALARELGQGTLELIGEFNIGEAFLLMDDAAAAEPHIHRALALDRKISGDPGRAVVALLEARLRLHQGDEQRARAIVAAIRARQEAARVRGEADHLMVPSEDVTCSMVELATRDGSSTEWDAIEARSERFSVGQERIEVIEARGLAAARLGRIDEARHHIGRALDLAAKIPTALGARLRRRLREPRPAAALEI
ncbi:Putative serine/threonine-protein kinase pknB [Minicystis rosea]|nr:Putative serine/threonine-protein kinase pknB [Minicystis rosea]